MYNYQNYAMLNYVKKCNRETLWTQLLCDNYCHNLNLCDCDGREKLVDPCESEVLSIIVTNVTKFL